MKNILTTLLLVFTLSLFSSTASAQSDTTEVTRICYNTSVKVKSYDKKGKANKEGKAKLKENCFELDSKYITMTDSKGKKTTFNVNSVEIIVNEDGITYLINSKANDKDYQLLVNGALQFIAIYDVKKNITVWYFMQL